MAGLGLEGACAQAQDQGEDMTWSPQRPGAAGHQEEAVPLSLAGTKFATRCSAIAQAQRAARCRGRSRRQVRDCRAKAPETAIGMDLRASGQRRTGGTRVHCGGTPMTETIIDPSVEALRVRPSNRVACWTTGSRPGRTGTRPTDSTCTGCPCDVR